MNPACHLTKWEEGDRWRAVLPFNESQGCNRGPAGSQEATGPVLCTPSPASLLFTNSVRVVQANTNFKLLP
jgi:hypothetical protein